MSVSVVFSKLFLSHNHTLKLDQKKLWGYNELKLTPYFGDTNKVIENKSLYKLGKEGMKMCAPLSKLNRVKLNYESQ